jgi:hypothetical protein
MSELVIGFYAYGKDDSVGCNFAGQAIVQIMDDDPLIAVLDLAALIIVGPVWTAWVDVVSTAVVQGLVLRKPFGVFQLGRLVGERRDGV